MAFSLINILTLCLVILDIGPLTLAKKIDVTLIYSSANEDTLTFLKTRWSPQENQTFKEYINWDLQLKTPYITLPKETGGREYSFKCEHGEHEVLGNKYHECAKKYINNNYELIQFIICYAKNTNVDSETTVILPDMHECSNNNTLLNHLENCAKGADVINSLVKSTSNINKLKLERKIPILLVDGQSNWNGNFSELKGHLCKKIEDINNLTNLCSSAISYNSYIALLIMQLILLHLYKQVQVKL